MEVSRSRKSLPPGPGPTLTIWPGSTPTSNFAALWLKDPILKRLKDLNLLKRYTKYQEAGSILKVIFALSNWPQLHRVDLIRVWYSFGITVFIKITQCICLLYDSFNSIYRLLIQVMKNSFLLIYNWSKLWQKVLKNIKTSSKTPSTKAT